MGSKMLQTIDSVGSDVKGSRAAVSGCGTTSMSLSLIACQPRTLEPSKPRPSSKTSSVSLSTGMVKCCQIPGKSMNRKSTALTFRSRHSAKTSLGDTMIRSFLGGRRQESTPHRSDRQRGRMGDNEARSEAPDAPMRLLVPIRERKKPYVITFPHDWHRGPIGPGREWAIPLRIAGFAKLVPANGRVVAV